MLASTVVRTVWVAALVAWCATVHAQTRIGATGATGPTGGVALGMSVYSGPTLQARAGWRVAPLFTVDVEAGLYLFATELLGKTDDGSMKTSYLSTRFATIGGSFGPWHALVIGLHGGVVRFAEMLSDPTGSAEISAVNIPAIEASLGWQFWQRPSYALALEAQGWACFSEHAGFVMDGALLFSVRLPGAGH